MIWKEKKNRKLLSLIFGRGREPLAARDRGGSGGARVRLLDLAGPWLDDSLQAEKNRVPSIIGEVFDIEEIDENGNPWISEWWRDEDGRCHSRSIALEPLEAGLFDEPSCNAESRQFSAWKDRRQYVLVVTWPLNAASPLSDIRVFRPQLRTPLRISSFIVLPFTTAEAEPLLKTISKIHRVTLVPESPYAGFSGHPRICLLDDGPFGSLNPVMLRFQGKTSWMVVGDLPRCYILANLAWNTDLAGRFYSPVSEQSQTAELIDQDPLRAIAVPSSIEEFREWAIEDMPALATLIEQRLDLKDKPSLGVEFSKTNLEFPLIEDSAATGNQRVNALLAADPVGYLENRRTTSEYDRLLHSWITDEEYGQLYDSLHDTPQWRNLPILARLAEQGIYGVLAIESVEIARLIDECKVAVLEYPHLTGAFDTIHRVCRSAIAYKLGLVIEGD